MIKNLLVSVACCLLIFQACTPDSSQRPFPRKPLFVSTTGMIGDMVKNIVADSATVFSLMGPGIDPHLFKASQKDIGKLADADAIFYNGLHLEGKMTSILKKISRLKPTIAISDGIEPARLRHPDEFEGQFDPHIWFDVSLWIAATQYLVTQLAKIDTAQAAFYQSNGQKYIQHLEILHQTVQQKISAIPEARRILITAHDAFGYFGAAYSIRVLGLQGISTVAEYGVNDVTRLVDLIVSQQVPAIFVESSLPTRSLEAIRAGCRARGAEVRIGGTLYSDALGEAGSDADTYIKMVLHNVNTIVEGLR